MRKRIVSILPAIGGLLIVSGVLWATGETTYQVALTKSIAQSGTGHAADVLQLGISDGTNAVRVSGTATGYVNVTTAAGSEVDVDVQKWGGTATTLGQKADTASVPVAFSTEDEADIDAISTRLGAGDVNARLTEIEGNTDPVTGLTEFADTTVGATAETVTGAGNRRWVKCCNRTNQNVCFGSAAGITCTGALTDGDLVEAGTCATWDPDNAVTFRYIAAAAATGLVTCLTGTR